jgi:predicted enzyme related to lactoylglutathione lyase
MNEHIYFEIQADDVQRAIGFYGETLGWTFEKAQGLPIEYWHIQAGSTPGGLLQRPANSPPPQCGTNAFVCSFQVDNFDSTAEKIGQKGGQVAMPKFHIPGKCWQGYFLDSEGNTFGLFEVDTAVK